MHQPRDNIGEPRQHVSTSPEVRSATHVRGFSAAGGASIDFQFVDEPAKELPLTPMQTRLKREKGGGGWRKNVDGVDSSGRPARLETRA